MVWAGLPLPGQPVGEEALQDRHHPAHRPAPKRSSRSAAAASSSGGLQVPVGGLGVGVSEVDAPGGSQQRCEPLRSALAAADIDTVTFSVAGEPTVELVRAGTALVRQQRCDAVVGFGGGGALDAAKAVAILATNGGDPLDYLETVGRGQVLERPALPWVAIPTTAGTGSEVTRNAVLTVPDAAVKASLRSPLMLARLAIVDPDLLVGMPRPTLAASGLDALSQLIEPYLSARANPLTDALAPEGIRRSARSLLRAGTDGIDGPDAAAEQTREDLALASLFGGLCLANSGLGAVHGIAAPAGGMFAAPHGAVCAALLAPALEVNLRALSARAPDHPSRARIHHVATLLTGDEAASAGDGIAWLHRLRTSLAIPGLAHYGMTEAHVPDLVSKAKQASSMRANPIQLTDHELTEIALQAL
jgi:alcohol dehydrogenase class IV